MKLLAVYGTRPEWIKVGPIIRELEKQGEIEFDLLKIGQHTNLIESYPHDFKINLNSIASSCPNCSRLDNVVGIILEKMKHFFCQNSEYTHVLVQGDTATAFSVALSAFHNGVKIIHVEAGLRTWDKDNPYPEEFYRQSISSMADVNFCPTWENKGNLVGSRGKKFVVGNTVLDSLRESGITGEVYTNKVIVTMHRRENLPEIRSWFAQIERLAVENKELDFVLYAHPNPKVRANLDVFEKVRIEDPLDYDDFIVELSKCLFTISDSGGIQEEMSWFRKPCYVCRKVTERVESLETTSTLCGTPEYLYRSVTDSIKKNGAYPVRTTVSSPYGDGYAAKKIVEILQKL